MHRGDRRYCVGARVAARDAASYLSLSLSRPSRFAQVSVMKNNPRVAGRERRVLMIAFHFPPMAGSSGVQRTLRFVQQLPEFGWHPIVLTVHPRAYETTSDDLLAEIPKGVVVERASAYDTSRHFSLFGRYPAFLMRPDRWRSWLWSGIPAGLSLIRKHEPDLIWSTYPIASAHQLAARLRTETRIPWIADFRDPMTERGYPSDPEIWRRFKKIEETVAQQASRLTFVTSSALQLYRDRYRDAPESSFALIENGYDEDSFVAAETSLQTRTAPSADGMTLLHSGIVYPSERDPVSLFAALGRLHTRGVLKRGSFRLRFRAAGHTALLQRLAVEHGIEFLIEVLPAIPYREALQEMLCADGLVVMQGTNCNEQIPAKVYEYLRARRPILGLADPQGDTGRMLQAAGIDAIARLEDTEAVEAALVKFVTTLLAGRAALPKDSAVAAASRRARTRELAALMDCVVSERSDGQG